VPSENKLERYLYDNKEDPYQKNPLKLNSAEENSIALELEGELKEWLVKLEDPFIIY